MNYLIKEETLTAIADSIRNKSNTDGFIPVADMAAIIDSIRTTSKPILEGITITPTGREIVEIPPFGSDGFGIVTVLGDNNLSPENILSGVVIYGVEGTAATDGGTDTSDATATSADIVDAATAYVNGKKIVGTHVCQADPILSVLYVMPTGEEFVETPADGTHGFSEVVVEGCEDLIPENILAGSTIYGVDGAVAFQADKEVTPGVDDQYIEPDYGYTAMTEVYVEGDSNLKPENIVEGVEIFGVRGTAATEEDFLNNKLDSKLQTKEVTPGRKDQTIEPDKDYLGLSSVEVLGDSNLISENIVDGVEIFGVRGTAVTIGDDSDYDNQMFILSTPKLIWENNEEEKEK